MRPHNIERSNLKYFLSIFRPKPHLAALYIWALSLQVSAKPSSFLIETSPFKGIWGQSAFRAEHPLHKPLSVGYTFENVETTGEREGNKDQSIRLAAELIWYLPMQGSQSFFASFGLSGEQETLAKQALNPYHRFGSSSTQDKYTFWKQKSNYLSMYQSIGLRFYSSYYWTASFKFLADELIAQSSNIESLQGDLATAESNSNIRANTKFKILLHVGLWIP